MNNCSHAMREVREEFTLIAQMHMKVRQPRHKIFAAAVYLKRTGRETYRGSRADLRNCVSLNDNRLIPEDLTSRHWNDIHVNKAVAHPRYFLVVGDRTHT